MNESFREKGSLIAQHPKHKTKSGFAQITRDGKVVDLESLSVGDMFEVMNDKCSVKAEVSEINSIIATEEPK